MMLALLLCRRQSRRDRWKDSETIRFDLSASYIYQVQYRPSFIVQRVMRLNDRLRRPMHGGSLTIPSAAVQRCSLNYSVCVLPVLSRWMNQGETDRLNMPLIQTAKRHWSWNFWVFFFCEEAPSIRHPQYSPNAWLDQRQNKNELIFIFYVFLFVFIVN